MMDTALPAAAQNYPLLNLFWTMLWFFLWAMWLFLLVRVGIDILRSHDMSGWAKAGWLAFMILLPFLGVLVYVIARGGKMQEREYAYVRTSGMVSGATDEAPAATSTADELTKLAVLRDKGILTDAEFAAQKAMVLR